MTAEPIVELNDVSFQYAGRPPVLAGVSIAIARGEVVALVGRSGVGKTTILKLVNRLLLPRLLTGEPPSLRTVSRLGHGGILTRDMRFRFPAYARALDAPDG